MHFIERNIRRIIPVPQRPISYWRDLIKLYSFTGMIEKSNSEKSTKHSHLMKTDLFTLAKSIADYLSSQITNMWILNLFIISMIFFLVLPYSVLIIRKPYKFLRFINPAAQRIKLRKDLLSGKVLMQRHALNISIGLPDQWKPIKQSL